MIQKMVFKPRIIRALCGLTMPRKLCSWLQCLLIFSLDQGLPGQPKLSAAELSIQWKNQGIFFSLRKMLIRMLSLLAFKLATTKTKNALVGSKGVICLLSYHLANALYKLMVYVWPLEYFLLRKAMLTDEQSRLRIQQDYSQYLWCLNG